MSTLSIQLKSPDSELSKTLNGWKISWISRKLWGKMYWQCHHCWYSWKALILSFPKLQMDWKLVEYWGSYEPKCTGNVNTVDNWKALILSFPKLQMDGKLVEYQGSYEPKCTGNVNTVDTVEKPWFWAFQNFKWIENQLNIKEVMRQNVLAMSTLLIQLKSPDSELSKTSNRLKIGWISRKLWAKMYWQCQHCWYSWKALILSFPKLQMDGKSVKYQGSYEPKCTGNVITVDTVEKPWFWAFQNFKWMENWLNIKEVMSQNVLAMLTLLIVEKPWFWAFQNFKWIENRLNINEVISQNVLAMSTLLIQRIKACNALNAMYVDTGDTNEKTHRLD